MFILNGKPLSPDRAFTTEDGRQFPANWLRLSTLEEKEAIGITEVPDPPTWDQRFYWGYDQDGQLIPKQLNDEPVLDENGDPTGEISTGLKTQWKQQQKVTAGTLLTPSDWFVIRGVEDPNKAVSQSLSAFRQAIRDVSSAREVQIEAVTTVEELVDLLNAQPTVYDPDTGSQIPNPDPYLTPWPEAVVM